MKYRFMRIFVFFDLPIETSADIRQYHQFRKFLIKNGFVMMQKSVYSKLVLNMTVGKSVMENLKRQPLKNGNVQMMVVTERQYQKIEYLIGSSTSDVIDTDDRMVIV